MKHRLSGIAVIAPHGGSIEGGTTELAEALAGDEHTFYSFVGLMGTDNYKTLHLTSTSFDEPHALEAIKDARIVIAIHGRRVDENTIYLGGSDEFLKEMVFEALNLHFNVENDPEFKAIDPLNICNRGSSGKGLQLELARGVRERMFENYRNPAGRRTRKDDFDKFVKVLKDTLLLYDSRTA